MKENILISSIVILISGYLILIPLTILSLIQKNYLLLMCCICSAYATSIITTILIINSLKKVRL